MVSLLITRIGKAIRRSGSAEEGYARLRRSGYLSRRAPGEREAVVATIAHTDRRPLTRRTTGGGAVRFEASADGAAGLLGLARGPMWLTIDAPMAGHGRRACVSLQVEDADRYYLEWRDRVAISRPPRDEPWGARTFSVHDPAGNTIFVMGPIPAAGSPPPAA